MSFLQYRKPDTQSKTPEVAPDRAEAIEYCARALINAVQARDAQGVAQALCDAFDILESMPHEENQEIPHTYDAQNKTVP